MAQSKTVFREYFEALMIAVIFAIFVRTYVVQAFKIPSASMEQNLLVGDHILVNKFVFGTGTSRLERALLPVRDVKRGDVVVFKYPEDPSRDFIKRCVGLPGDQVRVVDKRLYINEQPVADESYTYHLDRRIFPPSLYLPEDKRHRDNFGPYTVPEDHYFCLGDNRDFSLDSRVWGPVPAENVKGRAMLIYWSYDPPEPLPEGREGAWDKVKRIAGVALNFFPRTRWERSFKPVR